MPTSMALPERRLQWAPEKEDLHGPPLQERGSENRQK